MSTQIHALNGCFAHAVAEALIVRITLDDAPPIAARAWWHDGNAWTLRCLEDGARMLVDAHRVRTIEAVGVVVEEYDLSD